MDNRRESRETEGLIDEVGSHPVHGTVDDLGHPRDRLGQGKLRGAGLQDLEVLFRHLVQRIPDVLVPGLDLVVEHVLGAVQIQGLHDAVLDVLVVGRADLEG